MTILADRVISTPSSPSAQTHIFDIQGDLTEHIHRLINNTSKDLFVTFGERSFDWSLDDNDDWAKYMTRVHREIKLLMRKKLGLPNGTVVEYEALRDGVKFYWFYLTPKQESAATLLNRLLSSDVKLSKVFEILVSLHFKRHLILQAAEFFDVAPAWFNSELYINASPAGKPDKKGMVYINALTSELYCSDNQEIAFNLKRVSFKTSHSVSAVVPTSDTDLLFFGKEGRYQVTELGNAIKSRIPYMTFGKNYPLCVNYSEQLVFNALQYIFDCHQIPYLPRVFKADYELDEFLSLEKESKLPLIIIDNFGEYPAGPVDFQSALYSQLRQHLSPQDIVPSNCLPDLESLSQDCSYLVLNKSAKNNGSSICDMTTGKVYNSFWQALERFQRRDKGVKFDYYTQLKISRFQQQEPIVMQGLDIQNLDTKSKDECSGKSIIKYKEISAHKLDKIAVELWLKEQVFRHHRISDISLADSRFTAIKVRKTRKQLFASVAEITIKDGALSLGSVCKFYTEERLRHACPYLKERVVKKLYDDGFYLWDHDDKLLLSSYSSIRVPRIIGNSAVDTIKKQKGLNSGIGRTSKPDDTVLPYYLAPKARKQEHRIYLQHLATDLLCFVRPVNKPNVSIEKQNLVYNILVVTDKGESVSSMHARITDAYLRSFTINIHKLKETSKSSLFDKITSLLLGN